MFIEWLMSESSDEDAFLAKVRSNPKDQLTWLVFADWLDDRDDPRAGIIRGLVNPRMGLPDWTPYGADFKRTLALSFPVAANALAFDISLADSLVLMKSLKKGGDAHSVLTEVNRIVGGHGVEAIHGNWQGGRWASVVALYVNMGDTYDTTVIYVVPSGRFIISSVGDFVERRGRQLGIE